MNNIFSFSFMVLPDRVTTDGRELLILELNPYKELKVRIYKGICK